MSAEKGWQIKHRPDVVFDETGFHVVLKPENEKIIKGCFAGGHIPHLLLIGAPGIGKTTLARAIAKQREMELLVVPGKKANIEFMRNEVTSFVSTKSLRTNKGKMVLFDEGDQATHAVLEEFKLLFEKFSGDVVFVVTSNKHSFSGATYSRCLTIDFSINADDKKYMISSFCKRLMKILDQEKVVYDKKAVINFAIKNFPDFRHILKTLQIVSYTHHSIREDGTIQFNIPENFDKSSDNSTDIVQLLKEHIQTVDVKKQLDFIMQRSFSNVLTYIKDNVYDLFKQEEVIPVFGVLNKFDYQSKFVDHLDLNGVMMFVELKKYMK